MTNINDEVNNEVFYRMCFYYYRVIEELYVQELQLISEHFLIYRQHLQFLKGSKC